MLLTRREALRVTAASAATLALAPLSFAQDKKEEKAKGYSLPKLPYEYDALEPSIDAETMKIHHGKHHQAYVNNANKLLEQQFSRLKFSEGGSRTIAEELAHLAERGAPGKFFLASRGIIGAGLRESFNRAGLGGLDALIGEAFAELPADLGKINLNKFKAGGLTARHEHVGAEFCTVLKGAYRDELGVFAAGDFAAAYGEFNHQPVVHGEETCICLFATEGRLKAQGLLGRLAFAFADV